MLSRLSASLSERCQHRQDPNPYRLPLPVFSSSPHPESIRIPTQSRERIGNSAADRREGLDHYLGQPVGRRA